MKRPRRRTRRTQRATTKFPFGTSRGGIAMANLNDAGDLWSLPTKWSHKLPKARRREIPSSSLEFHGVTHFKDVRCLAREKKCYNQASPGRKKKKQQQGVPPDSVWEALTWWSKRLTFPLRSVFSPYFRQELRRLAQLRLASSSSSQVGHFSTWSDFVPKVEVQM